MIEFYHKILNLIKNNDPRTWWREYPPKFFYQGTTIKFNKVKKHLNSVFNNGNDQKIGLYIHIPFCKSRCHFCKFYSEIPKNKCEIDNYLDCLEKELVLYDINFKRTPLDTFYIGGGTPTILDKKEWHKLFRIIHKFFVFKKDAQILTEGTPETSTLSKLKVLSSLGVNRYSLGVQSFDKQVLKKANRGHNINDIYRAMDNIRRAGIKYNNFDILLGLAGENWDSYLFMLENIVKLKPDCLSFMTLDLYKGIHSDYKNQAKKIYFFKHSLKPKIFSYISYLLERVNYQKIEGFSDSTFVLKGREMSINRSLLNRFRLNPILGLGSTSYSSLGHLQYSMPLHNEEYFSSIQKKKKPLFFGVELTKDEYIRRYFILRYILWGKINKKDFRDKFNQDINRVINRKFQRLKNDQRIFDAGKDLIFLPSENVTRDISRYSTKNYGNQERSFLFCLKYFYSSKIINQYKKYLKTC